MRGIRDAINQAPSKPGFLIAAAVFVGLGGWYYGSTYLKCTEVREGRELLQAAIERARSSEPPLLNLADAVPGEWDEVRIVQNHRPGQVPLNCPFGWDMGWRERQDLIKDGLYTVIGFFRSNQFVRYIEYRADWARFEDAPEKLPRSSARFDMSISKGVVVLKLSK